MRWPLLLLVGLTGVLCGRAAAQELRLSVVAKTGAELSLLKPGGAVRDGDRLALRIECGQAAFLYVVHADREGLTLIDPQAAAERVAARVPRRVPMTWLVVEDGEPQHPQREELLIVAAQERLSEQEVKDRARASRQDGASPDEQQGARRRGPGHGALRGRRELRGPAARRGRHLVLAAQPQRRHHPWPEDPREVNQRTPFLRRYTSTSS